jgi:hypothetical protein
MSMKREIKKFEKRLAALESKVQPKFINIKLNIIIDNNIDLEETTMNFQKKFLQMKYR